MDQPMTVSHSVVVMEAAAERAVTVALPVLKKKRGPTEDYKSAYVDTCAKFYDVEFMLGDKATPSDRKTFTVRVNATTFKVVWTSDQE